MYEWLINANPDQIFAPATKFEPRHRVSKEERTYDRLDLIDNIVAFNMDAIYSAMVVFCWKLD